MTDRKTKRTTKILFIFGALSICFVIFLTTVYAKITLPRKSINLTTVKKEFALRGNIYSSDGFELSSSKRVYKASVNSRSIDPNKRELFINLFSIYSGISKDEIAQKISKNGYVVLSYNIGEPQAIALKQLSFNLNSQNVFREYEDSSGRIIPKMGLNIEISGDSRNYMYETSMEPILGYTNKIEKDNVTKNIGVKGLENSMEKYLNPNSDGIIKGKRDIGFYPIENGYSEIENREDGSDIVMSIPLKLQKKMERIIDRANNRIKSKEIVAGIIDPHSGRILALATTARFNPNSIKTEDYPSLNSN